MALEKVHDTYGEPYGNTGSSQTAFGFTGEETDGSGLVYLRARYYNPALGVFPSLDPLEGDMGQPMSLNGYGWVQGNVVNAVDPSGMIFETPDRWNTCAQTADLCYCKAVGTPERKRCEDRDPLYQCSPRTNTPVPPRYQIGFGLHTPVLTSTHGTCTTKEGDRPACAARAYQYAVRNYGKNGSLLWEDFIAMTVSGEAGFPLYQLDPGPETPLTGSEYGLECGFDVPFPSGNTGSTIVEKRNNCRKLRRLLESLAIGQLVQACNGNSCTEDDFIKYLGGIEGLPADKQNFGLQAWYGAALPTPTTPTSGTNPSPTPIPPVNIRLFNRLIGSYKNKDMRDSIQQLLASPGSAIKGNWGTVSSTSSRYWFATKGTGSQYGDVFEFVPVGTVNIK